MTAQGKDFLSRDDVRQALDELFDDCVAEYEASGETPSRDVRGFLKERGIEPPPESALNLRQHVKKAEAEAATPTVIVDPGTGKWCYERCKFGKNGEEICHMVCA